MAQQDRVAVATGASSGVGRATALQLGCNGSKLALLARGSDGLKAACAEIEGLGGDAIELGPIDVWINNAMTSVFSPVKELEADEIKRVTEVTYLGVVYGTLTALQRMLPRDEGSIVQVGSAPR